MSERWYYQHGEQTEGPLTAEELCRLSAAGQLGPTDLVWPEGGDRSQAVPARAVVESTDVAAADWFDDVPVLEEAPAAPADDGGGAEEVGEEFLSLDWDADALPADDELIAEEVEEAAEVVEAEPSCRLVVGSATSRGRVRDRNEDSLLVQQGSWAAGGRRRDLALVVVADGMGGHQAGDRASGLVVRAVGAALAPLLTAALQGEAPEPTLAERAEALERGLHEANRIVLHAAGQDAACKGMGSTAVAMLVWDGCASISLVGDCRVYHWRAGRLGQVTRDQTLVARMVELGQLTPEEAATHPKRNEVTQAVGKFSRIEPARYALDLSPGDWLIASCDGLYAHVEDRMLAEAVGKADGSAAALANQLVEMANEGGGSDNCTVVAVRCV